MAALMDQRATQGKAVWCFIGGHRTLEAVVAAVKEDRQCRTRLPEVKPASVPGRQQRGGDGLPDSSSEHLIQTVSGRMLLGIPVREAFSSLWG